MKKLQPQINNKNEGNGTRTTVLKRDAYSFGDHT